MPEGLIPKTVINSPQDLYHEPETSKLRKQYV